LGFQNPSPKKAVLAVDFNLKSSLQESLGSFFALGHLELTNENTHKFVISCSSEVRVAKLGELVPESDIISDGCPTSFSLINGTYVIFAANEERKRDLINGVYGNQRCSLLAFEVVVCVLLEALLVRIKTPMVVRFH